MSGETSARLFDLLKVLTGLLIFYVFLVVLMLAISQQSVMLRLADAGVKTGYSSAYASVREIERRREQLPALLFTVRSENERLAKTESALYQLQDEYHAAWGEFLPLLRRISENRSCGINVPSESIDKPEVRLGVWREADQCAKENGLPAGVGSQFSALAGSKSNFAVAHRQALVADGKMKDAQANLAKAQAQVATSRNLTEQESAAVNSFNEVRPLRRIPILGGEVLVSFPPALVQLWLSAVSGAFGALLVTLVLIVYPSNDLKLTSNAGFARMALGALIAVCVYVVLLGGTALLGTSSSFDSAGSNYMTFCAVSILAGMFSDRAAFWLSDRANVFFKRKDSTASKRSRSRPNLKPRSTSGQASA